jgi:ATP-binding cassette, subfamily C, bacterial LapB
MPDDRGDPLRERGGDSLLECLVELMRLNQRPMSAAALRAGLPAAGTRFTPELFVRAAERAGFTARVVERPLDGVPPAVLPAVLLLDSGRKACVLTALHEDGTAEAIFPGDGADPRRLPRAELSSAYAGFAIFAQPAHRLDDRAGDLDPVLRRSWFWGTLYRYRRDYSEVLIASVMINFFVLVAPLFVMNVYDRVVPNRAIETLWVLAVGAVTVFVFDFAFRMLRAYFVDGVGRKVDVIVSGQLLEHVLGIQLKHRPASAGSFANNVREFEALRDFFTSATLTALVDLPFSILFLVVIGLLGGPLVLVPLLAIVPVAVLGVVLQIPLTRVIKANFTVAAQKHGVLVEAIDGLETIKSVSAESAIQGKWEQAVGAVAATGLRAHVLSAIGVNFTLFMQQIVMIVMVIGGVYLIAGNLLTLGGLVACTILGSRALLPLAQVAGLLSRYQHARMAYQSLNQLMALPVERPAGKTFLRRARLEGNIELSRVVFRYPGQQLPALDGVTFRVAAGERVAILGRVGSGKSTSAKMIMALYQPDSGNVLVDGVDVTQLDPADLRRSVGYVPQDVKLFYGTVRENLVIGSRDAGDEAILKAARIAGVDKIVARQPAGFDLPVGEHGRGLSGGQRQAVANARALLCEPSMLVLDEPTGAMDFATEQAYVNALLQFLPGRTLILVTHKPTLLALVDRIIVLDFGRVVADGPKEKVLQALAQPAAPPAGRASP